MAHTTLFVLHQEKNTRLASGQVFGLFQYKVLPFGLCNAPSCFQQFVNDTFREYLDDFLVVYLDDLLIFSPDPVTHTKHVRLILQRLQEAQLSLKIEKCEFDVQTVNFLGYVITPTHIAMDPEKVEAVFQWKAPTCVRDIQVFLGLTNFYKRFIKDYSKLCVPLTNLLKKDKQFDWNEKAESTFQLLKTAITKNPILRYYNPELPCILETDASDYAIGAVLNQINPDDNLPHPIAFFSRKLLPAEMNYQIHDKELLAIIDSFKHWRRGLVINKEH